MQNAVEQTVSPEFMKIAPQLLKDFSGGNTRRKRNSQDYAELLASVKKQGILQAPVVRPSNTNVNEYEVVFGHNRRDAAIDSGLTAITVEVRRDLSDRDALEAHLEENLVRSDLTFSDQVRAAVRWTSFYSGDRKSAAERLNWTQTRLAEKLELANCIEEVLDALDAGEIKAGHALILATMPEKTQRGSLKTVTIEGLSVKALKDRAAKIRLPLDSAIFDKSDCTDCVNNSSRQNDLFGMGSADATCSNGACYRTKTHSALATKKAYLEEQFGKVIFMSESVQSDRKTVDPVNVGQEQFESGCQGCEHRSALLDDRPTNEGKVVQSQCLNITCFNECVAAFSSANSQTDDTAGVSNKAAETSVVTEQAKNSQKSVPTSIAKVANQKVAAKTPTKVIDTHKAEIVSFAKQHLIDNEVFRLAYMIVSVEHFGSKSYKDSLTRLDNLLKKDKAALFAELSEVITQSVNESNTFANHISEFQFMQRALKNTNGGVDAAIKAWQPSEDNLGAYYTEGLKSVCKDAGLDKHKDYNSWAAGAKKAFISSILKVKHDWSAIAPRVFKVLAQKGNV